LHEQQLLTRKLWLVNYVLMMKARLASGNVSHMLVPQHNSKIKKWIQVTFISSLNFSLNLWLKKVDTKF